MMQLFKHTYLKYFLLILLSVKAVYFVAENISSTYNIEVCCDIEADDFEHEGEDKNEFDETEKIHQLTFFSEGLNDYSLKFKHSKFSENYLTRYLEFTTPPPELA